MPRIPAPREIYNQCHWRVLVVIRECRQTGLQIVGRSQYRQTLFRDTDSPFELAAIAFGASKLSRLPRAIEKPASMFLRIGARLLDNLLRPDMTAILIARSLYGKSMLHIDTLLTLYDWASRCRGAIVEIGPFVGGGTIMMASAMARAGNTAPIIAIEVGGVNENPLMPTDDVIRDLRKNLAKYDLSERVSIVEGWSNVVADQVVRLLGDTKIGMLIIDADGEVARDLLIYQRHLLPNAMVVIDDYEVNEPNIKSTVVHAAVDKLVMEGVLRKTKIVPWGTWFGTYCG
jgi:predicted O-methyltransferase YrrM